MTHPILDGPLLELPEKPPPAAPDPRWESVYVTVKPDLYDTQRITIALKVGSRDMEWHCIVDPRWHSSSFPGMWDLIIERMVDGIDRAMGWKPYNPEPLFADHMLRDRDRPTWAGWF